MTPINESTRLIDVVLEAYKTPFAFGEKKSMHIIPTLEDYLLAVRKESAFSLMPPKKLKDFLESSTSLTPIHHFRIPYYGLPKTTYGQAMIEIPDANPTPLLAVHKKVEGRTLHDFYGKNWRDATAQKKIMAKWPQKTFDDFFEQACLAAEKGNTVDFGTTGNALISREKSEAPKLSHIDLLYNSNDIRFGPINTLYFFNTEFNGDNPPELFEKLFKAAENAKFGLQEGKEDGARILLQRGFGEEMAKK